MFEPVVFGVILILVYFLFFYESRTNRLLKAFPLFVECHHPIFGIIPFFLNLERAEILKAMVNWELSIGRLWSPFGSALLITKADIAEKIFNSQSNIAKGFDYDYVRPWLGDGLLLSTGEKWNRRRKMLTPTFHFKILEDFMEVFNKESLKMVKIMRKECSTRKDFDMYHYVSRCTLDIICETAMGVSVNAQDVKAVHESEYINAIKGLGRIIQDRSFRPWLRSQFLFKFTNLYKRHQTFLKVLHGFTEKVIAERKIEFLKNQGYSSKDKDKSSGDVKEESIYFKSKKRRLAFLDLLLEVQRDKGSAELSDKDIREETDTFMFEGHDTTSAAVSFSLYALGCYPEIQRKVHEELETIFGDSERSVTTEDLTRMKYLESVIKESLRIYPSVPFIQRKLSTDIPLDDGRIIPEGTTVGVFIYKIHKDPLAFPNPNKFDPERFLTQSHDPYAFVPFSAGPRNCIGQKFAIMEEKVLLANILRNFKVVSKTPPENLKLLSEMVLRVEDGFPMEITPK